MAVYTPLADADIAAFLEHYAIGTLVSAKGIEEGVENTNYLINVIPSVAEGSKPGKDPSTPLRCAQDDSTNYILTLFEQRTKLEDLPYFTTLMGWLAERGISCPLPILRKDGRALGVLAEKPALIVSFLQGSGVRVPKREHMAPLGKLMADMHIAGMDFPHRRKNALSLSGWDELAAKIENRVDEIDGELHDLITNELRFLHEYWPSNLPSGPVHADLFPDNVFFERGKLTGVIDFYFACHEAWAYDLAITINAWCFDDRHRFVKERADALMYSYCDRRPLSPEEEQAMPILLRGAALRFLLTRAHDWLFTPADAVVTKKDPMEYAAKLRFHQERMA